MNNGRTNDNKNKYKNKLKMDMKDKKESWEYGGREQSVFRDIIIL